MSTQATENTSQPQASQSGASEANSSGFAIPESYADRGWTKTISSYDDLWKSFDNAQSLIGKKSIPSQDDPQEKWDAFYDTLGRPKDPNEYQLTDKFEGLPEGLDLTEAQMSAKKLAHSVGLTPKQADALWQGYMKLELEKFGSEVARTQEQEANLDKQFDDLGRELYGDKFEAISSQAQSFLRDKLPDNLKDVVAELGSNPKALVAMVALSEKSMSEIAEVKRQYGAEDKLASGGQASGESVEDINAKLNDARARWQKSPVFSEQRKNIDAEILALRAKLKSIVK